MGLTMRFAIVAALLAPICVSAELAIVLKPLEVPSLGRSPASEDKVDINSATLEELMKVPGMTRTWAARVVRFRPYRAKNDLVDRGVVTHEVYDRIKDYIVAHREKQ